ncbi:MAG TPA: hypothetical protein VMB50_20845 [Myxococcales bacterium]|nr:hypothetical protein [Myxococcales bacterium]
MGSGLPFWGDAVGKIPYFCETAPTAWDLLYVGPNLDLLPALVDVRSRGRPMRLDHKKAPGRDGASDTQHGYDCATFEIDVIMWRADQWTAVQQMLPLFQPGKLPPLDVEAVPLVGNAPAPIITSSSSTQELPVQVSHPALASLKVYAIVVPTIIPPRTWKGRNDIQYLTLMAREWRKPKSGKVKTARGVSAVAGIRLAPQLQPATTIQTPPSQAGAAAP